MEIVNRDMGKLARDNFISTQRRCKDVAGRDQGEDEYLLNSLTISTTTRLIIHLSAGLHEAFLIR